MLPLDLNSTAYYKSKITLSLRTTIKKNGKKKVKKCYPVFNNDGLSYTPSFALESDIEIF